MLACTDDASDPARAEPPTNEVLKQGITIDGLGGTENSMAVGTLRVHLAEQVLEGVTEISLLLNNEEVARTTSAPFSLESMNTRELEDGAYTLRVLVTYADGTQREATYAIEVSNVLLSLNNNLFDLHAGYADTYGERLAIIRRSERSFSVYVCWYSKRNAMEQYPGGRSRAISRYVPVLFCKLYRNLRSCLPHPRRNVYLKRYLDTRSVSAFDN
ncbi:hypothetical protein [Cesiribacter andamanensis]|nr:hypothetical protein [Cesiribacter andamanensis]